MSLYPWQKKNWDYLTHIVNRGKTFPSALLLWGQKGLGQQQFAEHFSAWLLCEAPQQEGACGKCSACQWLAAGTHPDRLILLPESDSSSIKIDAVRDIRAFSEQKSHGGKYRVIIISPAEAMNVSAANALLKILEEPFDNTLFLLVSYHLSWLLPTILSRCQKIHFPPINDDLHLFKTETKKKIETIMDQVVLQKIHPMEAAEAMKVIEKESQMNFESLLDILLVFMHQKVTAGEKEMHLWYLFYDKLLTMKGHLKKGININQAIWLEDLFWSLLC